MMKEPMVAPSSAPASSHVPSGASRWWVYVILAIVVAGFGYFIYHELQASKASGADNSKRAVHDLPVMVERVRRGDLDQYLVGLGTVTPLNTVTVKSRVDGAITDILFTEGQKVTKGQRLIDIDSAPYDAALAQAQGQLQKDSAALESASWNVEADEKAIKENAGISELQLHQDTATRDSDKGLVALDTAAIQAANVNIAYCHITSPIDGTIGLRLVDLGNIVHASDTTGLLVITQLQPITVIFTVAEDNIDQVQKRINSGLAVPVDAYDRDLTQKIATGTLLAIDNEIDPTTGTVKIKAIFDNTDKALFPSAFVNARMLVNTIKNAVLVPSAAIQHSPSSTFAYVVVPDPKADKSADKSPATAPSTSPAKESKIVTMRQVVTGPVQPAIGSENEDTTVVVSGLQPGDVVVTDGVDKLIEGTKVIPTFAEHAKRAGTTRESTTMPTTQAKRQRKPRPSGDE
jgi:membrane fusion protein, multidrug efflux system